MNAKKQNSIKFLQQKLPHSTSTLNQYWFWIERLCRFANVKKAEQITPNQLLAFFNSLTHLSARTTAQAHNAIRQIYKVVLWHKMSLEFQQQFDQIIQNPKQPKSLPTKDFELLSPQQIQSWINNISNPTLRVGCTLLYNPGLLYPQLIQLQIHNIRSWGSLLIVNGKRLSVPPACQKALSQQRKLAKLQNDIWLFPSPRRGHLSAATFQKTLQRARPDNIPIGSGARCLRASYIISELRSGRNPNELMWQLSIGPHQMAQYCRLTKLM